MDPTSNAFLHFLGRLHPLVVHFPIALLLVAGVVEAYHALVKRRRTPAPSAVTCVAFGALGAIASASFGWLYAENDPPGRTVEDLLFWHRWVGVATAAVATLAALVIFSLRSAASREGRGVRVYRAALAAAVVLVTVGSHLGGELVYGEGYLWEAFESREPSPTPTTVPAQDRATDPVESDSDDPLGATATIASRDPGAQVDDAQRGIADDRADDPVDDGGAGDATGTQVDYLTQIAPIFEARCSECHGATGRAKAGLRLHDMSEVMSGDPTYWVIEPGNAERSLLVELIRKPADSEDLMPSEGEPLTPEQIQLIVDWIDQGAKYPSGGESAGGAGAAPAADASKSPVVEPATAPSVEPPAPDDAVLASDHDAIALAIREHGGYAARVSMDAADFEVNLGLAGAQTTDESLALLSGLEADLVWLDLSRSAVTDAGASTLARFERLQRLRLDRTRIGDATLASLAGLEALEVLNLVGTDVTDAGLESLHGLSNLERVFLWQTDVTDEGVARLAAALPALEIVRGIGER